MFMLSATKQKIDLVPLETSVDTDPATRRLMVRVRGRKEADPVNAASLITRASRAFFEIGQQPGKRALARAEQAPKGAPPVAFREAKTGLLHVVYHEVVTRFRAGIPQRKRQQILNKYGLKIRRTNSFVRDQVVVFHPRHRYSGDKLLEIANQLSEMEEVVFSTPNFVTQFVRQAVPSIRIDEWHLRNTGAKGGKRGEDVNIVDAWKTTTGKQSVVVAVLDDGVDVAHPNLKARIWKNRNPRAADRIGRDFFLPDSHPDHFNPRPKRFQFPFDQMTGNDIHGTCCAGVVAAAGRPGGSVGAAPKCRILPVKIFHADDLAADERVADAVRYAAQHADIISCSWSGGFSTDLQLALEDVGQSRNGRGVAVFCATGNEDSPVGFPASDPNAIGVGASTDQGKRASYSNFGPEVAFVAPSSDDDRQGIFTTDVSLPNRGFNIGRANQGGIDGLHTNDFGGTSSATPLAAGIAALVLSVQPRLSRTALRDLLAANADKIGRGYGADGHSNQFGFGRLNAGKAIDAALSMIRNSRQAARLEPRQIRVRSKKTVKSTSTRRRKKSRHS